MDGGAFWIILRDAMLRIAPQDEGCSGSLGSGIYAGRANPLHLQPDPRVLWRDEQMLREEI